MGTSGPFTPIYVKIRDFIRNGIDAGQFQPGERLPSEKELSTQFTTTRATVSRALQELVFEGLVERRAGSGSFVRQQEMTIPFETTRIRSFDDQIADSGERITYRLVGFNASNDSRAATALKITDPDSEGTMYLLERLRLANTQPLSLEQRYIPAYIGNQLTVSALNTLSIHRILEEVVAEPVASIEGVIHVGLAGTRIGPLLDLSPNAPVLIRDYVLMNADRKPLVFGISYYKEQFRIPYHVAQPPSVVTK